MCIRDSRQSRSVEISLLMSVLIAKFSDVYQLESPARISAAKITDLEKRVQNLTISMTAVFSTGDGP